MSRFWGGNSSSSDEQDSRSEDESSVEMRKPQANTGKIFAGAFDESDSDSDDDKVREVKSQKDRTWDGIMEGVLKVRNAMKINDWSVLQDEFSNVNKQIEKSKNLIAIHGMPLFYIKMLAEVEDHVVASLKDKEAVKKLKPAPARALNQLKLQVRKHNDNYRTEIEDFRANPAKYEDVVVAKKPAKHDSSDDSDSNSGSDDDSDSLSSESSGDSDSGTELKGRARWLKKPTAAATNKKKPTKKFESSDEESDDDSEDDDGPRKVDKVDQPAVVKEEKVYVPKTYSAPARRTYEVADMSVEDLDKEVTEAMTMRGKKNSNHREILRRFEMLAIAARPHGPRKEIPVLMHLVTSMFDTQHGIDDFMDLHQWNSCYRALSRVMSLLEANVNLSLRPYTTEELAHVAGAKTEEPVAAQNNTIAVAGSLFFFVLKLEQEYTKSLQQINPHTQDYVALLANEANLVELQDRSLVYFKRNGDLRNAASVALLIVEHIYYKHDSHAKAVTKAHHFNKKWGAYTDLHPACKGRSDFSTVEFGNVSHFHPASFRGHPSVEVPVVDFRGKLEELCGFVFKHGDERDRTRALLCSVFYHALHDRYYEARDMFLMAHVQDFIEKADIPTQILYNRTVVTLGLCAFRLGFYAKAHDCLSIICSGRTKELLAQGSFRSHDKDIEQEKQERRRQMPYHMHINPELLECCHLTCAMILELPHLARSMANGSSHIVVSRQLRKHLAGYNKQAFVGPPETTREHVLAATKAVLSGDWRRAYQYLYELEVWNLIPNDGGKVIKDLLRVRIQEEAVRCYLLLNSGSYDSMDLTSLCQMFELEQFQVRKIICRMIFQKEISASWEHSGTILHIYSTESSALQTTAVSVSEKLGQLLESNERIVDSLVGVYGYKDDWNTRDGKKQWHGQHNNNQGHENAAGARYKNRLKTSYRPVVHNNKRHPGSRNNKTHANKTDGNNNNASSGNKNAWVQKRHNNNRSSSENQASQ